MHSIKTFIYGYVIGDSIGFNMLYNKELKNKKLIRNNYKYTSNTVFMLSTIESIIDRKKIDNVNIINKICTSLILNKYNIDGKILKINESTLNVLNSYSLKNKIINNELNECDPLSRVIPLILYKKNINDHELLSNIVKVVSLTHQSEEVILGCYIYAKYCLNLLNGLNKYDSLKIDIPSSFSEVCVKKYKSLIKGKIRFRKLICSNNIVDTLNIVIYSILHTKNYVSSITLIDKFNNYNNNYCAYIGFISSILYKSKSIPNKYVNIIKNKDIIDKIIKKYERVIK